jgi:hypothetical protein
VGNGGVIALEALRQTCISDQLEIHQHISLPMPVLCSTAGNAQDSSLSDSQKVAAQQDLVIAHLSVLIIHVLHSHSLWVTVLRFAFGCRFFEILSRL